MRDDEGDRADNPAPQPEKRTTRKDPPFTGPDPKLQATFITAAGIDWALHKSEDTAAYCAREADDLTVPITHKEIEALDSPELVGSVHEKMLQAIATIKLVIPGSTIIGGKVLRR